MVRKYQTPVLRLQTCYCIMDRGKNLNRILYAIYHIVYYLIFSFLTSYFNFYYNMFIFQVRYFLIGVKPVDCECLKCEILPHFQYQDFNTISGIIYCFKIIILSSLCLMGYWVILKKNLEPLKLYSQAWQEQQPWGRWRWEASWLSRPR